MTIARNFLNISYKNIGGLIDELLEEAGSPKCDEDRFSFYFIYHFFDGSEIVLEQHKYDGKWEKYLQ